MAKCPSCEETLTYLKKASGLSAVEERHTHRVYVCPHCDAVLGVTDSKE